MVFSSLTFLLYFLPLTLLLYFVKRSIRWRNGVLLAASLIFYAWGEPIWILGMLGSTLLNYICAQRIGREKTKRGRKRWLLLGTGGALALLFVCKYAAFFYNSVVGVLVPSLRIKGMALPIGISFYTFQIISYTVDVYRRKVRPQTHFSLLLLYVSCFPQLIAGPIVQYGDIAQQIVKRQSTADDFACGMQRFAVGLGKKVIFANLCGAALAKMPLAGAQLSLGGAWYAMLLYTLQIYFDFSGYSDMAIGLGRVLGFSYKENFLYPYAAASVREFWRRWHISLGSFFREYVYIPLGGNRGGLGKTVRNTMIVWLLTGLWHGAAWSFVVWGLYYGVLLTLDLLFFRRLEHYVPRFAGRLITFLLVVIGWTIFYYPSLGDAMIHIGAMLGIGCKGLMDAASLQVIRSYSIFPLLALIASLPLAPALKNLAARSGLSPRLCDGVRTAFLSASFVLSVLFLVGQSYNPFIYFQF